VKLTAEVLHPGSDAVVPVKCVRGETSWQMDVPLQRGCAVIRIWVGG